MEISGILFHTHSGLRYIVLLLLIVGIVKMLLGWFGGQSWSALDRRLAVWNPLVLTIQWLLGLGMWFLNIPGWFSGRNVGSIEHLVTMTLGMAAAHAGWSRAKRQTEDGARFRSMAIGLIVAGLLVGVGVARITGVM